MFSLVLFSSSSSWGQLVCGHVFFVPFESLDSHGVKKLWDENSTKSSYLISDCVYMIWLLHFFLLGGNSIASKSPWTNSDLRSSRQLEENTEDKTEAGVKNPQTLCLTVWWPLWLYYSRQWSFVITTRSNSDFSLAMRSDERRLKLSCCIVRSLINATIQGFHRDEELMLKARRLFANHSPC